MLWLKSQLLFVFYICSYQIKYIKVSRGSVPIDISNFIIPYLINDSNQKLIRSKDSINFYEINQSNINYQIFLLNSA
jgi:hypothetical protein